MSPVVLGLLTRLWQVQGLAEDDQGMAIPMQHLIMQPPMQHPSQPLHPSIELLAAMEGWDPMRMYNLAQFGRPMGGEVTSLEGAGRMGQEGGVMSRSMPVQPSQAGTAIPQYSSKRKRMRG
jgi:hypothetical protein